jgi:hypothetical protein
VLPTGQVLYTKQSSQVQLYTPSGSATAAWRPTISVVPGTVVRGQTYPITGTQFNGLTEGAYYGDDLQAATNYPLVRLTNQGTGHVLYARTHGHSRMGVASGALPVSTFFDVPATAELGATDVEVVANGIASATSTISISPGGLAPTVTVIVPTSGPAAGGTAVTITGTSFAAGATVALGGVAATGVTVVNATTITATTGAHAAGAVNVVVTNPGGLSGTLASGFSYGSLPPPPTVTSITPNSGSTAGGTGVTITGSNFVAGATVALGGVAATGVTVVNATTITATTSAHAAGAVNVVVTNPNLQSGSLTKGFLYVTPPAVASITPDSSSMVGGTGDFVAGALMALGNVAATGLTVNARTITATSRAHAVGAVIP